MFRFASACSIAMVAALAAPAIASAADLDQVIYAPDMPTTKPVEIGSGWYIRGDLGYSLQTDGDVDTYRTYDPFTSTYGSSNWDAGSGLSSDWSGSVGVGYRFNEWLRADATFDYTQGDFAGSTTNALFGCDGTAGNSCRSTDAQDFDSYGFMVNGYVDLGTFAGFTPYAGGGVGITNVNYGDYTTTLFDCPAGGACSQFSSDTQSGASTWRFTYALAAGVAYDLTQNLKLDVGYRYTDVDGGDMFDFSDAAKTAGATGAQSEDNGFSKHEVRVGLRYEIW